MSPFSGEEEKVEQVKDISKEEALFFGVHLGIGGRDFKNTRTRL